MSNIPNPDRRAEALERLDKTNTMILWEMERIRAHLAVRPTRTEMNRKRHTVAVRMAIAIMLVAVTVVQVHDLHIDECGPGRRSERVLEAIVTGRLDPANEPERMQQIANEGNNGFFCDALFPTHTHDESRWPNGWNVIGLGSYLVLVVAAGWAFARHWNFFPNEPNNDGRHIDEHQDNHHQSGGVQRSDGP